MVVMPMMPMVMMSLRLLCAVVVAHNR